MTLLRQDSGCKVGWEVYDDEAEARVAAERESEARERKFDQGYDFGYQWPGSVAFYDDHPTYGKNVWVVVTT